MADFVEEFLVVVVVNLYSTKRVALQYPQFVFSTHTHTLSILGYSTIAEIFESEAIYVLLLTISAIISITKGFTGCPPEQSTGMYRYEPVHPN
jgi:hypothetical protein